MFFSALTTILVIFLIPQIAFGYGGGIHLQLGASILANLPKIAPGVATIIALYPNDFLYGCISADITVGKKFTHYLLNCHRWQIGKKILGAASNDSQRACAYGYLCHLAADVIAHNYYVPYKIMRSFATITMNHAYWEMRFETFVDKKIWDTARQVCTTDQSKNDQLMRSVIAPTIFSFGTNKRIFNSIMLLSRLEKWQQVMQSLSDNSRYHLAESDRDEYMQLTLENIFNFLQNPESSDILNSDPTGDRALMVAEAVRKNLRLLYKSGKLTKQDGFNQVEALKETLRLSLHNQSLLQELHNTSAPTLLQKIRFHSKKLKN